MTRFWRTVRRKSNPVDPEVNKRILKNLPKEKKNIQNWLVQKKFAMILNKENNNLRAIRHK